MTRRLNGHQFDNPSQLRVRIECKRATIKLGNFPVHAMGTRRQLANSL